MMGSASVQPGQNCRRRRESCAERSRDPSAGRHSSAAGSTWASAVARDTCAKAYAGPDLLTSSASSVPSEAQMAVPMTVCAVRHSAQCLRSPLDFRGGASANWDLQAAVRADPLQQWSGIHIYGKDVAEIEMHCHPRTRDGASCEMLSSATNSPTGKRAAQGTG